VDRLLAIAAACEKHGVYTLVDFHQDNWSKYVGADGAPFWAHHPALPPEDIDERNGGHGPTSVATQAAFDGFFSDHDGLVADYARTAAELAKRIDRKPGVIGLELMNEPTASPDDLLYFSNQVSRAVRATAPSLPIYFEPSATRNLLDIANPPRVDVDRIIYSPHLYTGVFQGNWKIGATERIENSVTKMFDEAAINSAPIVITEFGNNPLDPNGADWIESAFTVLNRHLVSASFWVYEEWPSTCGNPSCWGLYDEAPVPGAMPPRFTRSLRDAAVTHVAQPYPRAIAALLDSFAYDSPTRTLTVQFHNAYPGNPHVLGAPDRVYPSGVVVTCDDHRVAATRLPGRVEVACTGTKLVLSPATP
jgi:endoglycosylceramidase